MRVLIVEDELRMASLIRRGLVSEGLAADVAASGEDALWMAQAHDYDAIVLDVMLPGIDGFETCRRLREGRRLGAGADADGARLGRGSRRRARQRSGRLPGQAVRLRGAARPAARAGPPRRARAARRCSRWATYGSTRRRARSGAATTAIHALREGVRAARDLHAPARRGAVALRSCSSTPGTSPTRTAPTSSTSTSASCARKIDEPFGRDSLRDGSRRRLPAARRTAAREPAADPRSGSPRHSPSRWRSCSPARAGSSTCASTPTSPTALDRDLRLRAQDMAALVRQPGASLATRRRRPLRRARRELRPARRCRTGSVLDATPPLGGAPLLVARRAAARAHASTIYVDRPSVPGLDEPSRLLATPVDAQGRPARARRRRHSAGPRRDARQPPRRAADRWPDRARCSPAARRLRCSPALSLRPVESMRRRAAAISAETPGERLPVPQTRRRARSGSARR